MAEFDQFGAEYRESLKRSIRGLATVDSALSSKLQVLQKLTANNDQIKNGFALDFGCGTGLLTGKLNRFARHILGADVSLVSLKHREELSASFLKFDGHVLPVRTGSIDLVVASCVFHHIPSSDRPAVLSEIYRVLGPGGLLVIIEHNPYNPVTRFVINRCEFDRDAELLSLSAARKMAREAGLEEFRSGYFYAIPPTRKLFRTIDCRLASMPIGAQYYCSMSKQERH